MRISGIPGDIWLLQMTPALLQRMKPVTTGEIYEVGTNNLHKDGLFSVEIFGALGTEGRDVAYSYITLNTEILHPRVYNRLGDIRQFYHDLMAGRKYGIWNAERMDFDQADATDKGARTGYGFFMSHVKDIRLLRNDSSQRNGRIDMLEKAGDSIVYKHWPVIPAGLRDIVVDPAGGRTSEDEVNGMYRSVISTANAISITSASINDPVLDAPRMSIQKKIVEIADYFKTIFGGKKGFGQSKWAARKVRNSAANVISPMVITAKQLGTPNAPTTNDVQLGLYQAVVSVLPMTMYFLHSGFLGQVFQTDGRTAIYLTNRKSLHKELVMPTTDDLALFASREGYERIVHRLKYADNRNKPIVTQTGHYIGLLYAGVEGWRFFQDIADLPASFDRDKVYPINWTSLIYLSGYRHWRDFPSANTRYPVAGIESTIMKAMLVKTTTVSDVLPELDGFWKRMGPQYVAQNFPRQERDAGFVETMSVHVIDEGALAADHDGDRMNQTPAYTIEAINEFKKARQTREWYVGPNGRFIKSAGVDNVSLTLKLITGVRNES